MVGNVTHNIHTIKIITIFHNTLEMIAEELTDRIQIVKKRLI